MPKSIRSILAWCLLLAQIAVAVAGCGTTSGNSIRLPSPSLVIGVSDPLATLNPVTMGTSEETNFANFVWAGLLRVGWDGVPLPMLATTVPSESSGTIGLGGRAITFHLRANLRWSNGWPITSADVRFGWQLATQSWADVCPAVCGVIRQVVTNGPRSVTFLLSRPFAPVLFDLPPVLPRRFIWKGSWLATRNFLFATSSTWFGSRFPVDGPFRVTASTASSVTLTPNPYWNLLQKPHLRLVRVNVYPTDAALLSAVQSGSVDLAQGFTVTDFLNHVINPGQLGSLKLKLFPTGGLEHLELKVSGRRSPLAKLKVRQALNLAINREALLEKGLVVPSGQVHKLLAYSVEMPGRFDGISVRGVWDPVRSRFVTGPNLRDADTLLAQAGYVKENGYLYSSRCPGKPACQLTLSVAAPKTYIDRIYEAENLQDLWGRAGGHRSPEALGIKTKLDYTQWSVGNLITPYDQHGQHPGPCAGGAFDICLFAQIPGYDPQTDFELEFTSSHRSRVGRGPTDLNFSGIADPSIDHVFGTAGQTYDLGTRRALYRQWQARVAKQVYWIPLYYQPFIVIERRSVAHFQPTNRAAEWNPWQLGP